MASQSREERVADLIRAGEMEMTGEHVDDHFAPGFAFHGPDGFDADYEGLKRYFCTPSRRYRVEMIERG